MVMVCNAQHYFQLLCPTIFFGIKYSGGVGTVVRSQPPNPEVPSSIPDPGLNIWVTFFPTKVHSAFHPSGVGKMSTSTHGPL